jgi:hypothetical protein
MSQLTEMVVTTIGGLIMAGGGGAAIAFALFKVFGEKWLNAKFEERLAEYKHAQQKEIEQDGFTILKRSRTPSSRGGAHMLGGGDRTGSQRHGALGEPPIP